MKQITMQEALRAVADGKCVHFENLNGSNGIIKSDFSFISFFSQSKYFIKETVKVGVFRHIISISEGYTLLLFESEYKPSPNIAQVSDWVEIDLYPNTIDVIK